MAMTSHCRQIANQVARLYIVECIDQNFEYFLLPLLPYINCMLILSSDAWVRSIDVRSLYRVPIWCLWSGRIALETDD